MQAGLPYAGLYYHDATGLYLAMYRAYDPVTAHWLERDPIGEAGGMNLYAYGMGNPVSYTDPSGHFPVATALAIWAAVEVGLSAYDAYNTVALLLDLCATAAAKAATVGGFALDVAGPAGGWTGAADDAAKGVANKILFSVGCRGLS